MSQGTDKKFQNNMKVTPARLKVIQGAAFDGLEGIKDHKTKNSMMQERHQSILAMQPQMKVNPNSYAMDLIKKQGLEQAAKIAKSTVYSLEQLSSNLEGLKYKDLIVKNSRSDLVFWRNVVAVIMKNGGSKFQFTQDALKALQASSQIDSHHVAKKRKQIDSEIKRIEEKN